jgi:hypothetical protein
LRLSKSESSRKRVGEAKGEMVWKRKKAQDMEEGFIEVHRLFIHAYFQAQGAPERV